jgi:hypothetical protein
VWSVTRHTSVTRPGPETGTYFNSIRVASIQFDPLPSKGGERAPPQKGRERSPGCTSGTGDAQANGASVRPFGAPAHGEVIATGVTICLSTF